VGFFPELAGLPETTKLHVRFVWQGLSAESPLDIDYQLTLVGRSFEGAAVQSAGGQGNPLAAHPVVTRRKLAIPHDAVRAFLQSVLNAPAEEAKYQPRIDHTDDYPVLVIELQGPTGPVTIGTASQPAIVDGHFTRAPWGILFANRTLVVATCVIDRALEPLSRDYLKEPRLVPAAWVGMRSAIRPPVSCP
jgi:hypothetical protein